ncbi:hypothetical protein PP938_gp124 [Rhizobium phage AF3]|uniref:Uncharacterized protein n=1 Tax=Rhizobium phage AF3 TaxID=2763529 RepID=A0A7G7WW97_9CAUD|nr:hypothetical protein PP938_gp124 [Rhizobium phage AF3]QNH71491.1 hypothetical protein AF3_124 [Rhizobium phage AF3]
MFILQTVLDRSNVNTVFKIDNLDSRDPGFNRWAHQINTFFHRTAQDQIRYNVTNLRIFTRYFDDEWKAKEEIDEKYGLHYVASQLDSMNAFFTAVGFNYKKRTWKNPEEHSMKWNDKLNRYVHP